MYYDLKGYLYHIVRVNDLDSENTPIELFAIVREIFKVLLNDLPTIPVEQKIYFGIGYLPNTKPISIPPYRMAPAKLKMLKARLNDLLGKGFIRPSFYVIRRFFG